MVSEPGTGQCASEDTGFTRGVDCEIPISWRGERSIPYKSVEISP